MKGLRWRMGSVSVQRVTSDVMTRLDTGALYITNKKVLFDGASRNVSITLGRITKFTVFKDGMQVEKSSGRDAYFTGTADWEVAGACLDGALSKNRE